MKLLTKLFTLALLLPAYSFADGHSAEEEHDKNVWYAELRYTNIFSADASLDDPDTSGSKVISTPGSGAEGSSSMGISLGKQINENTGITIAYEKSDIDYEAGAAVRQDGQVFDYLNSSVDMQVIMIEAEYKKPITEKASWLVFAGLGYTMFDVKDEAMAGSLSNTPFTDGQPSDNSDTATRIGIGGTYSISDEVELIALVQISNYGKVKQHLNDGTSVEYDVDGTETALRLRYSF